MKGYSNGINHPRTENHYSCNTRPQYMSVYPYVAMYI